MKLSVTQTHKVLNPVSLSSYYHQHTKSYTPEFSLLASCRAGLTASPSPHSPNHTEISSVAQNNISPLPSNRNPFPAAEIPPRFMFRIPPPSTSPIALQIRGTPSLRPPRLVWSLTSSGPTIALH